MIKNFWQWLTENLGFLTTKGFVIAYGFGISGAGIFYHFLIEGEQTGGLELVELIFVGVISFLLALIFGLIVFGEKWPALNFGNYWDNLHEQHTPEVTTKKRDSNPLINDILDFLDHERQPQDTKKKEG